MSEVGRRVYLKDKFGDYDECGRRLHYCKDNPYEGPDADSMLYLRLFEDEEGRTIAASHSARPFAGGSEPSGADTWIHRLENDRWVDITEAALPPEVSRTWYFQFNEPGDLVPCGPYTRFARHDGRGMALKFGPKARDLRWKNGKFCVVSGGG